MRRRATALAALGRQALHAAELGFEHPITGKSLRFESPLPADMQALLDGFAGRISGKSSAPAAKHPLAPLRHL